MQPFEFELLLVPSAVILCATLCVAYKMTHSVVISVLVSFLKAGLFLFYFGFLFDGTFTFVDDWFYLRGGRELYIEGMNISNIAESWKLALIIGGGGHFVYYLYNTYAFHFFGEGYYAPVAMNILLTLLVAWFGTNMAAQEFKINGVYKRWFFVFLLLHPDILAWSNVMNGKDIFVLLAHVLLLLSCSLLFRRRLVAAIALAVPVYILLFFMRFYAPLIFALALFISLFFGQEKREYSSRFFLGGVLAILIFVVLGAEDLRHVFSLLRKDFVNPIYGFARFILTPIPFHTEMKYSFLDLSALIHWLLFPFACWGIVVVHRLRTKFSRFFLLYVLAFSCLYAIFGGLQGPRHRVQLDYAWAVFQFVGVIAFLRFSVAPSRRMTRQCQDAVPS